jgi:hypothetical protein
MRNSPFRQWRRIVHPGLEVPDCDFCEMDVDVDMNLQSPGQLDFQSHFDGIVCESKFLIKKAAGFYFRILIRIYQEILISETVLTETYISRLIRTISSFLEFITLNLGLYK